jgi:hypothetical protein
MVDSGTKIKLCTSEEDTRKKAIEWLAKSHRADSSGKGLAFRKAKWQPLRYSSFTLKQ